MKKNSIVLFVLFISLMTLALSFFPGHNGDMPFYIASIVEKEGIAKTSVFEKTRDILKQELPEGEFIEHAARLAKADPKIMNFYRVKPLYINIITLFHEMGFSYVRSTVLPSLIAYFFIGILVFCWAYHVVKPMQALIIGILIMLINPVVILARLSSPDALSCLSLLGALICIYFEKKSGWTFLLLLLSIWIRMDNFISVLIILTCMWRWYNPVSRNKIKGRTYFAMVLLVCLMISGMNAYFEQDFWWFRKASYFSSPKMYGFQLLVYYLSLSQSFLIALVLFFVIIRFRIPIRIREKTGFCLLMTGSVFLGRLILFPSFEERFAAAYYIFALFLLIDLINKGLNTGLTVKSVEENMFF